MKKYQFLKTLDELDFLPLESSAENVLYDSIKQSLEQVGIAYSKAVINHVCKLSGMSEREVLTNCDLFEDSIYRLFGHGATSVISKVKLIALRTALMESKSELTMPEILDPSLTISDVLNEIRRMETLDFIKKMASYSRIAFLYSTKDSLNKILSEYFGPQETTTVLLSDNPGSYSYLNPTSTISYGELFGTSSGPPCPREVASVRLQERLDQVKATTARENMSNVPLRLAEDDATWWIRNGHTPNLIAIEQSIIRRMTDTTSILCAFDITKLNARQLTKMKSIVIFYDYVVIEEPAFAIYRFNKPTFRAT